MCFDASPYPGSRPLPGLDGHRDARALVRLFQCAFCSYILRNPLTLPCGNSCCRQCLPPSHHRPYITFPALASRQYAITCPFPECQEDHTVEDCAVNVVLAKVIDSIKNQIADFRNQEMNVPGITMDEVLHLPPPVDPEPIADVALLEKGHSHTAPGGRLLATYDFAESGSLHYTSDVSYQVAEGSVENPDLDSRLLSTLKEHTWKELECHVCYNLMFDPTTTPCGHTFCRKCLARILDHSPLCPICRRELFLPPSLTNQPNNKYLVQLLESLCPDQVAARAEAVAVEERSAPEGLDTPLFVCTLSFPGLRTYLHIFEPRYRLMVRRAIDSNGLFGMVPYNRYYEPQGRLGRTHFMECGTMLQIERYQLLPDGRSFIECKGVSRFRIRAHGMLDGYVVANVQKLEDIALAEEERIEAFETNHGVDHTQTGNGGPDQIDRLPTSMLFNISMSFVTRAREQSARWFSNRLLETYGEPPNEPAMLPYWLAAILPLVDEEKYKVLPTTSIRERLKITAKWVHRIEAQRW